MRLLLLSLIKTGPRNRSGPKDSFGGTYGKYFFIFKEWSDIIVYIITNPRHTVLYTGFTDDVERRTYEHKNQLRDSFTKKYNCCKLIYFEEFNNADEALHREHQIKRYKREWKINLITSQNPAWDDLYDMFLTY